MRSPRWTAATSAVVAVALATCGHVGWAQQGSSVAADTSRAVSIDHREEAAPSPLARRVSLMLVDATIRDALETLSAQSGVSLTYSSDDLASATRISFAARDVSVGAALHIILARTALHAVALPDGAIVLTTHSVRVLQQSPVSAPPSNAGRTVSGRVIRLDGSPVQGRRWA